MRRLTLLFLALSGCAILPSDLPPRPEIKTLETNAAATPDSLGAAPSKNPEALQAWWESFGRSDLDQLIETALREKPDLAAAQARVEAASRAERLASLEVNSPQYSTDASISRHRLSDNGLFPTSFTGKLYTQMLASQSISYDLGWWSRNRSLLRAARSDSQAAQEEVAAVQLDISTAVADAYFAWAGVLAQLENSRELVRCRRQELDLREHRYVLGLDAASPGLDARRKLDLEEDFLNQLEYLDRAWRYRLSALIGSDPNHADELPTPSLDASMPPLPENLPLGWLAYRPDIAALRSRIEAASARSDATKAEFYPNLDLRLLAGLDSLDLAQFIDSRSLMGAVGVSVHLPLFNTSRLRARLGIREAEYSHAVSVYNRAILDGAQQSADAYALIESLEQRSRAQRSASNETEKIRDLAQRREGLGLVGPIETLESESALLGQRLRETETQTALLRARVSFFRALGGSINPNLADQP